MIYLIVNVLILIFPVAYWSYRRAVPLPAWGILIILGILFDLIQVRVLGIYWFSEELLTLGLPPGEYLFIIGLPLRAIAFYELCSNLRRPLSR